LPKNLGKYLSLSNKLNIVIGILIKYLTVIAVLILRLLRLIYYPQPAFSLSPIAAIGIPDGTRLGIGVNVSSFLDFIESGIVASNILVS
jgi:hypothetical protein